MYGQTCTMPNISFAFSMVGAKILEWNKESHV